MKLRLFTNQHGFWITKNTHTIFSISKGWRGARWFSWEFHRSKDTPNRYFNVCVGIPHRHHGVHVYFYWRKLNVDWQVMWLSIILGLVAFAVAGCGGGQATAEDIAQHDADVQAMALVHKDATIMPVNCSNGSCK